MLTPCQGQPDLDDGGRRFFQNTDTYLSHYLVTHVRLTADDDDNEENEEEEGEGEEEEFGVLVE